MISCTDSVVIPLVVDVTTVNNVSDKPVYPDVVSNLFHEILKYIIW
ncbi:hypothetical protein BH23THE1_BH23THE1_24720 [soil metagenome]